MDPHDRLSVVLQSILPAFQRRVAECWLERKSLFHLSLVFAGLFCKKALAFQSCLNKLRVGQYRKDGMPIRKQGLRRPFDKGYQDSGSSTNRI